MQLPIHIIHIMHFGQATISFPIMTMIALQQIQQKFYQHCVLL